MTRRATKAVRSALLFPLVFGACYPRRLEPVRLLVMQLRSTTPVLLTSSRPDGTLVTSVCETLTADVQVQQLRGDTLFYAQLSNRWFSRLERPCGTVGPGYIDLAAHPNITTVVAVKSRALSALALPAAALLVLGALGVGALLSVAVF